MSTLTRRFTILLMTIISLATIGGHVSANVEIPAGSFLTAGTSDTWNSGGGYSVFLVYTNIDFDPGYYVEFEPEAWWSGNDTTIRQGCCGWGTHNPQVDAAPSGAVLYMQDDGNLTFSVSGSTTYWETSTSGNPGAFLRLQDDGNLLVMAPDTVTVLWSIH